MKFKQHSQNNSDAWKKISIAAVLIVAAFGFLLFLEGKANVGLSKADSSVTGMASAQDIEYYTSQLGFSAQDAKYYASQLGEACVWKNDNPYQFYVISKFRDAKGKYLPAPPGWEALVGCLNSKTSCTSPNGETKSGNSNYQSPVYFCEGGSKGDTSWMVCDKNGTGKLSKEKGAEGITGEYYCDGKSWVPCYDDDAGKIVKFGSSATSSNLYCDGDVWHTIAKKGLSCDYIAASDLKTFDTKCHEGYGGAETCDVPAWHVTEPYEVSGRVACCAEKNQCAKLDGSCVSVGTVSGTSLCDNGVTTGGILQTDWVSSTTDYSYMASGIHGGGKYILKEGKWLACQTDGQTEKRDSVSYVCKNKKWIMPEKCQSCSSEEKCIFSDEYEKVYANLPSTKQNLLKSAEDANRVSCGKPTQCVTINGGKINYDSLSSDASYICGESNHWLKCAANAKNVVSDGGNYICNGEKWQIINNQKKGCSGCIKNEFCVASNLYSTYSLDKGDWAGLTWAYFSKRVGCTSDSEGCADTTGVGWGHDTRKDNKYICSNNRWFTCDKSAMSQVSTSGTYLCSGKDYWTSCGVTPGMDSKPGDTLGKEFLCSKDGWKECVNQGVVEADTSWLCLDKKLTKCDSSAKGSLVLGLYSCDGSKWKYNYVDLSGNIIIGDGKTGPLSGKGSGTTGVTKTVPATSTNSGVRK